jgi:hypothetical protein
MPKSVSHDRKLTIYPAPKYYNLLAASSKTSEVSLSSLVCKAIKAYYDGMPNNKIEDLLSLTNID